MIKIINKKMDNTMISIISAIMVVVGFSNGMMITTLFDHCENRRLRNLLGKALDMKFELEKKIDELNEELKEERKEKNELLQKINGVLKQYMSLPPPSGSLERCEGCCSDHDSETEDEFNCPTSPDVKQSSTE